MNAEIISIGTELLLGRIVNTNAAYIARRLASLGVDVYHQMTVGDNPRRLIEVIRKAALRSDAIIMTGGLGPTVDDITIPSVAELAGKRLILNKTVLKDLKDYCRLRGRNMPPDNVRQAYLPEGAKWIRNLMGTAPGLIIEWRGKVIICLPGPPRELYPMFERDIEPYIKKKFKVSQALKIRTVKLIGLPESYVNRAAKDILGLKPPTTVGIYAKLGEVELVIMSSLPGGRGDAAIKRIESKIKSRLGKYIFGFDGDTLEGSVGSLLLKKRLTIAVAESCTGGLVSSRITDVSGSSKYFKAGVVAYSNEEKENLLGVRRATIVRYGAVSAQVASELAAGVRHYACTDIGLGITGIAGPTGGTKIKPVGLVYISLSAGNRMITKKLRFKGSRADIKWQVSQAALDMVRKELCGRS